MKYKDLLKQYKEGKLPEEVCAAVEEDLEKQEAISEYLYRRDEDLLEAPDVSETEQAVFPEHEVLTRSIRKAVRRVFLRMGVIVTALVLLITFLMLTVLPKLVDRFYYDPKLLVSVEDTETSSAQDTVFELGMRCYTELFLPARYMTDASIEPQGYGKYSFTVYPSVYRSGTAQPVFAGKIERGQIEFYNPWALNLPVQNAFEWTANWYDREQKLSQQIAAPKETTDAEGQDVTELFALGMGGYKEDARISLEELTKNQRIRAYITLDQIHSYDEAKEFSKKHDLINPWYGVVTDAKLPRVIGMYGQVISASDGEICLKDYPYIYGYEAKDDDPFKGLDSDENATKHFLSMLNYLKDQDRFSRMMKLEQINRGDIDNSIRYVSERGLQIYGVVVSATVEEVLSVLEDNDVFSIGYELEP